MNSIVDAGRYVISGEMMYDFITSDAGNKLGEASLKIAEGFSVDEEIAITDRAIKVFQGVLGINRALNLAIENSSCPAVARVTKEVAIRALLSNEKISEIVKETVIKKIMTGTLDTVAYTSYQLCLEDPYHQFAADHTTIDSVIRHPWMSVAVVSIKSSVVDVMYKKMFSSTKK